MALRFCDGFDSYGATSDLTKKWASANSPWTWGSTLGRFGGGGISAATTGAVALPTFNGTFAATGVFCDGFWAKFSAAPASTASFRIYRDTAGAQMWALRLNTSGQIIIASSSNNPNVTGSVNVCDNSWHWIEVYLGATAGGTVKLNVDGSSEGTTNYTNNGSNHTFDRCEFVSVASRTVTFDDVMVWDTGTGGPIDTDYPLGPRQITTLRPSSDSAVQFTRSVGSTNASCVDETNGDTSDYVDDATSGDQDLYGYGDLGFTPDTITAVMLNSYIANPGGGSINHKQICKSGSTQTDGSSVATPASATIVQQPFPTDPATGAAWTGAGVDSATFGFKVP